MRSAYNYLLLIFIIFLSACDMQNVKPETNSAEEISDIAETNQAAQIAYQNEDWKKAEIAYMKLTKKIPAETEPWFRLGNIYARTDRLDAAEYAYKNALSRDTKNSKIWHNLGIVQLRQATSTFIEMLEYTDTSDPLNVRAKNVVNSVTNLMSTGFESTETE
ncbi:MAG: tetratricopeptide repeat protein [Proteobacteria bacterium]|nr:tetratricopeptide repeat protein [Pseudomonadota bacterium]NOG59742.1 tetratricopeptide repeat protein [Pseudomonadota bacterium]